MESTNPLYLQNPKFTCPVCGAFLLPGEGMPPRPCPYGPHEESQT